MPEVRIYKEVYKYTQVNQSTRIHASDTKINAYRKTNLARSLWSDYKSACLLSIGHQTELLFAFNSCTIISVYMYCTSMRTCIEEKKLIAQLSEKS